MQSHPRPRPLILCILDGWGERGGAADNAIETAHMPVWHRLTARWPHAQLQASEHYVGLPDGQMGNSEVGHTNLGAGRLVMQDLPRIDAAIAAGEPAQMPALRDFIARLKETGGTAHVLGLLSPGGVHSHQRQIAAFARILAEAGVPVAIHALLDGRDTPPKAALSDLKDFQSDLADLDNQKIATVIGRYYAMDRDKRWDRVENAYRAIVDRVGDTAADAASAVEAAYRRGETDEFVQPAAIGGYRGMRDGDGLLIANFRADRVREIAGALLDPDFSGFARQRRIGFAAALGLVEYSSELNRFLETLFPPEDLADTLGEVLAKAGLRQLRIAETEKYAHVTFFFNGGRETLFPGEERILVPSPKVATYDLQPEMSAIEVTDRVVEAIEAGRFDMIVLNYANADMVGHTGRLDAAVKAVETIDKCLGRVAAAVEKSGGTLVVTADHGNAETMRDPETGEPHTAHTLNPVPFLVVNPPAAVACLEGGCLADVAPTLLAILDLDQPLAMTGHSLIRLEPSRLSAD
ncbi:MAG TPA: 2,3-bisphosphoglycerate-independent phosphoglycerate mutase [Stellaceae bacterium]|jgi:2,3-bisphosphoglycerate-independent phosphoglycerate mutase|nr:2,3-bisphosphoglycerate-independent phosphoglycerate mutase [Stellaceae bacterium]